MMDKELTCIIPHQDARYDQRIIRSTRADMLKQLEPHLENGKSYLIKITMTDGCGLDDTQLRLSLEEVPCHRPGFVREEK